MTETEWLAATDAPAMARWLAGVDAGVRVRRLDRKLRLFACAVARQAGLEGCRRSLQAVEVAERLADGQATEEERRRFHDTDTPIHAARSCLFSLPAGAAVWTAQRLLAPVSSVRLAARHMADALRDIVTPFRPAWADERPCARCGGVQRFRPWEPLPEWESRLPGRWHCGACGLLREDLEGFSEAWRTGEAARAAWLTADARRLAEDAYLHREPGGALGAGALARAADALEEAGAVLLCPRCLGRKAVHDWGVALSGDNGRVACPLCRGAGQLVSALLAHLRRPGGLHFRGCWAVDLMTGRDSAWAVPGGASP